VHDHCFPRIFGTYRNCVGVPSEGAEPHGTAGEVVAPAVIMVPSGHLASIKNASNASRISGCPTATCDGGLGASNPFPVKQTIRSQRLRDMLAAIAEWQRASGTDRAYWRSQAGHLIRQWRRRYPHYWEAAA
jgi:hypothetical protein